jgi:AI-2 transport protein TqsA
MTPVAPMPSVDRGFPRAVVILLGLAGGVIVVAGMRSASGIVAPLVLALVITITVQPMRAWLNRHVPPWASTLICVVVVNAVLLGLGVSLLIATARFGTLVAGYQDDFNQRVADLTQHLNAAGVSSEQIAHLTSGLDISDLSGVVSAALAGVADVLSGVVFIFALVLFMTLDGSTMPRHLADAALLRPGLIGALASFAQVTRRYLLVSTVFGFGVAVLDTIALEILGVPAPLLWGLLAFLTNYIPNIGFIIGLIPPAILALLDSGVGEMIAVIVIYCLLNLIIQSVIQPRVVGEAVGLSTTITFLSLVFWAWVLGPLGALLAVPMSLLVRSVFLDADPDSNWLRPLVSNRADDPPRSEPGRHEADVTGATE